MHVHLAFVKLDRDQGDVDDDSVARLNAALVAALGAFDAEVMPAADHPSRLAWDLAIVVRGDPEAMADVASAIEETLREWPVGAHKGWSFAAGASR